MVSGVDSAISPVELLRSPWRSNLSDLLSIPQEFLLLASPFITQPVAQWIGEHLAKNTAIKQMRILCLTNLRVESVLAESLELEGLAQLGRAFPTFASIHLPGLHAKVFIADHKRAIVTSGNLTHGGLKGNCEYGVAIRIPELVREIRQDFEGYARLGAPLSVDEITDFAKELEDLRTAYQVRERQVIRKAGAAFKLKLRSAQDRVLRFRAKGKSNQAIFCDTIEYLLSKRPLQTTELHPLIQQIHPDLCDNSVDRVIEGVNFGKKWKHHVRTAQQALKREGRISYDGERWHLSGAQYRALR
jgi:PLD-like domain